jgi:hypothetical protein
MPRGPACARSRPDGSEPDVQRDGRPLTIGRGPGQRPRPVRRPRLPPPRPPLRPARRAAPGRSGSTERLVGERSAGRGDGTRGGGPDRVGDTILVVESFEDA